METESGTKDEDASRKRAWRQAPYSRAVQNVVVEVGRKQSPHLNAPNVLPHRERERSQRRRDAAKAAAAEAAEAARESGEACKPRMEQEALLAEHRELVQRLASARQLVRQMRGCIGPG